MKGKNKRQAKQQVPPSITGYTPDVTYSQIRYYDDQLLMPYSPMPSWFGFLRIEADLALTFIGFAKIRLRLEGAAARSLENARKALAQIERCLMDPTRYGISEIEMVFLEQRCALIELALRDFVPGKDGFRETTPGRAPLPVFPPSLPPGS